MKHLTTYRQAEPQHSGFCFYEKKEEEALSKLPLVVTDYS